MDVYMDYDETRAIVDSKGWDGFMEYLEEKYSDLDLYNVSMSWYESNEYICKAKGAEGDLVISWIV